MIIGVGVEGPSDRAFLDKVLHKHFRRWRFDLRMMKDRARLIRETPRLLETFRDAGYSAGFIVVDRDDTPCATGVIDEFDDSIRIEARKPLEDRFLFICVAVRGLEAWFLAEEAAILSSLPDVAYKAPPDTGTLDAGTRITGLWRSKYPATAFNKIDFAKTIAPKFSPSAARMHSASFNHFWTKINAKCSEK